MRCVSSLRGRHDRATVAQHAGDRAGHHRADGQHARGADARLRHQHRRRHFDTQGRAGVAGVPVFANCREAVLATGAVASVAMAPPLETLAAVEEALAAGIRLIVTVAEGVPQHDAIRIGRAARAPVPPGSAVQRPGMAIPGEIKLGFHAGCLPAPGSARHHVEERHAVLRGRLPTRTARLRAEHMGWRRRRSGEGHSLRRSAAVSSAMNARTAVILVGEVGGTEEEECADVLGGWVCASRSMR